MNRIICLDFDGVLCDSIDECLLVTYNAYNNLSAKKLEDVDAELATFFYKYRYFVRPAGEYYILMKAFESQIDELNEQVFNSLRRSHKAEIRNFQESFFDARNVLKKNDAFWLSLHKLYNNAAGFLELCENNIYIVTNKDCDSIEKISKSYGYYNKIKGIYSKEISTDKKVLIKTLLESHHIDLDRNELIFVDDNIDNLKDIQTLKDVKVRAYLATWGYTNNAQDETLESIDDLRQLL